MSDSTIDWDAVREEASETLSQYVKLDSSHPVGRTVETAELIAERLAAEGIASKVYETPDPNKVNLVARLQGRQNPVGKPLLITTTWTWSRPSPRTGRSIRTRARSPNGYIYGRGTLDDKGMGIMELMTMLLLKRQSVELERDVLVLYTCDEEIGSPLGAQFMVENHFADLDPAFVLDEGGCGAARLLQRRRRLRDLGRREEDLPLTTDRPRRARPRLAALGGGGHPSPDPRRQPLLDAPPEDRECAAGGRDDPAPGRRVGPRGDRLAARTPAAAARHGRLTMMEGGYKINIIPEKAEMSFDCRLLPDTDAQRVRLERRADRQRRRDRVERRLADTRPP